MLFGYMVGRHGLAGTVEALMDVLPSHLAMDPVPAREIVHRGTRALGAALAVLREPPGRRGPA